MSSLNYKSICELKDKSWNVNVCGVVKFFRDPIRIVRTGDYQLSMTLVDESCEKEIENGIRCNLFAESVEKLPRVDKIGCIVLLRRVKVAMFNSRLQLQRMKDYSWVVCDPDDVMKRSSLHFRPVITDYDKLRIAELRAFYSRIKITLAESETPTAQDTKLTPLSDIKLDTYINVLVQIVAVNHFDTGTPAKALLLKVSDGTKVQYSCLYQAGRVVTSEVSDMSKATVSICCDVCVFDEHVDDVVKMKVGDCVHITNLHVTGVGDVLVDKCKNEIGIKQNGDLTNWAELVVHSGTSYGRGIELVPPDDPRVVSITDKLSDTTITYNVQTVLHDLVQKVLANGELLNSRSDDQPTISKKTPLDGPQGCSKKAFSDVDVAHETAKKPLLYDRKTRLDDQKTHSTEELFCVQEMLTTTAHPLQPISPIALIKQSRNNTSKFRLRAKVLDISPNNMKSIIKVVCEQCNESTPLHNMVNNALQCLHCENNCLKVVYMFRLLVEDETGILEIVAHGNESRHFFNNVGADELVKDNDLLLDFDEKLKLLSQWKSGNDGDMSTVPCADLCVYLCKATKHYNMFGTMLA